MNNRFRIDEDSRMLREMRKLSQTELADQLGLGIATINRWENMHKEPTEDNFEMPITAESGSTGSRNNSTGKSLRTMPYCFFMEPKRL